MGSLWTGRNQPLAEDVRMSNASIPAGPSSPQPIIFPTAFLDPRQNAIPSIFPCHPTARPAAFRPQPISVPFAHISRTSAIPPGPQSRPTDNVDSTVVSRVAFYRTMGLGGPDGATATATTTATATAATSPGLHSAAISPAAVSRRTAAATGRWTCVEGVLAPAPASASVQQAWQPRRHSGAVLDGGTIAVAPSPAPPTAAAIDFLTAAVASAGGSAVPDATSPTPYNTAIDVEVDSASSTAVDGDVKFKRPRGAIHDREAADVEPPRWRKRRREWSPPSRLTTATVAGPHNRGPRTASQSRKSCKRKTNLGEGSYLGRSSTAAAAAATAAAASMAWSTEPTVSDVLSSTTTDSVADADADADVDADAADSATSSPPAANVDVDANHDMSMTSVEAVGAHTISFSPSPSTSKSSPANGGIKRPIRVRDQEVTYNWPLVTQPKPGRCRRLQKRVEESKQGLRKIGVDAPSRWCASNNELSKRRRSCK
ncbi:hypothetical protein Vretimale_14669 [Volvox reticuliferus]|uniref:Uncharacterized protein n=1 Tax=Volvox reticuliferus TaxID=1737510 RepID=A0A8J4GPM8_9CHLO|nr:hypothetical protein Vretifemale_15696 [Volvox reticuliferus]GIM11129.1 hypothetical protein Vretimale_14669 [Volvox reticuliferus]